MNSSATDPNPLTPQMTAWLREACERDARGLSLTATSNGVRVRIRPAWSVDHVLPAALATSVRAWWLKRAGLDLIDRARPQAGVLRLAPGCVAPEAVAAAVAILPVRDGWRIHVALEREAAPPRTLAQLDASPTVLQQAESLGKLGSGLVIFTGAPGAGRRDVLRACVQSLDQPHRVVLSLAAAQGGFRTDLLRQRPDVVAIGELWRDPERLRAAVELSAAGCLVLGEMPSPDVAAAIDLFAGMCRVHDAGADELPAAVCAVGALGRACACARVDAPTALERERLARHGVAAPSSLRRPVGCDRCTHTGVSGRLFVQERLVLTAAVQEHLRAAHGDAERRTVIRAAGTRSLLQNAVDQVAAGATTLEEVWAAGLG